MKFFCRLLKCLSGVPLVFFLTSCDPWFSFSPFEAKLDKAYHDTTEKNLARIAALDSHDSRSFKLALLSDPHYHFEDLQDAIRQINADKEYLFAIVAGDLTENGLRQEFIYFHNIMSELDIPYVTLIGNHDYLANGERVYAQMFGSYNYSFTFNNVKFVMFDNTTIESGKTPDLEWLSAEFLNSHVYDHLIPFAHVPPYDVQMKDHYEVYHELIRTNGVRLSIHGHRHDFSIEDVYGDGLQYLTVSSPQKRTFTELTVSPSGLEVKKVEY